ncbi:MAG: NAD(P)H-hydrate dehydratase [Phycisphaerales bacterium]|nr:NAD(P)H-hydrate dehydratase [Phycisphaerales bacterium]
MADHLPPRPADGHKGTFGTVGIVGGCNERGPSVCDPPGSSGTMMIGAPALAARAALRCGCGRVIIGAARSILAPILTCCHSATGWPLTMDEEPLSDGSVVPRVLELDRQVQTLAVGPGFGIKRTVSGGIVRELLSRPGAPLVLDADALHGMAQAQPSGRLRDVVLTPHPGEFRVLAEAYSTGDAGVDDESRRAAAIELAAATEAVVVLKGHGTVVATRDGAWTCPTGGVELAVPGSGDVLTGVLASVLAQQVARGDLDVVGAARLAVTLHANAGAVWREAHGDRGMLAEELADALPAASR